MRFIIFAGLPHAIQSAGIDRVTTAPAPITERAPITTPFNIIQRAPIITSSSIVICLLFVFNISLTAPVYAHNLKSDNQNQSQYSHLLS